MRCSLAAAGAASLVIVCAFSARAELPYWIRNLQAATEREQAFFRTMAMPYGDVLFRRPPSETRPALADLIKKKPEDAELYSLRALEDEQQLDFAAAESDWRLHLEKSRDKGAAQLALADFYHRRLRGQDEIAALMVVANAPLAPDDRFVPSREQRSWRAFERIFTVIRAQAFSKETSVSQYRAWIARYPDEPSLYVRYLDFLLGQKDYSAANDVIRAYALRFPDDQVFQIKAKALVEYRQGSIQQGLGVYEKSFQPLWDPELVKSYFDLLAKTQSLRKFLDQARADLAANPENLNATARVFYYYQQQGKLDAAEQAITDLRARKEARHSTWTPQELYTCGRLLEDIHSYPEASRYYFALYSSEGSPESQERALTRLADILLTAPDAQVAFGGGNLSIYKDIATLDQGPGYLNGILSLILNTTSPAGEYAEEEQRAVPYFHRGRAAELVAMLDKKFPQADGRPELHAKLLDYYDASAKNEAVLKGGQDFLSAFPRAPQRTHVSLLMADADSRMDRTQDEFAIYDAVLKELAAQADQMPLGSGTIVASPGAEDTGGRLGDIPQQPADEGGAFNVNTQVDTQTNAGARSPEYSRVLERYLARLVESRQIPQALNVLRREIDHNPDDPGLYERLADFLAQNKIGAEQEEVYRRAIARFPDKSWYDKLARYYLRYKKTSQFDQLTREAVQQFDGTDLESYFRSVVGGSPQMYLQLNLYAHGRFPHNPYFVRNLLNAYRDPHTANHAAWEALIREHWFEKADLRDQYFEYLSASGKLEGELSSLSKDGQAPSPGWGKVAQENPAAAEYAAQVDLWRSHFEESAPVLQALAAQYPAEPELAATASSVFRSLAYFEPRDTAVAVKIEENLLAANPGNTDLLARIGDIYSDRELFADAAPYWERIPQVAPGESAGYLQAATIYWDYYDFDNALRILNEGRKRLSDPTRFGYEVGAIYEGKRDYPAAIREYARAVLASSGKESQALGRLVDLSRRPQYRDLVNRETEALVASSGYTTAVISLRVRILNAENRKADLSTFIRSAINAATTLEQLSELEALAEQNSLEDDRLLALERQVSLATDPVTRLQLRYAQVRLYESRGDSAAAQRTIDALYRENPKILGVVRATVDFDWRAKRQAEAIGVLLQASKAAYPELGKQFAFEAARKSTEAHQYPQAREILNPLLNDSPYNAEYLAAYADTYAQSDDQEGLKQFYLDKMTLLRDAPLPADDRKDRIAALRRGLILALTTLKEYPAAVDQYIEILNTFPEDASLATEASLYALRHQLQAQLLDFYNKTLLQSPRDARWPVVVARIESTFENYPAAIEAYGKAIAIRPDRTDLRIARASLSERLQHFDDAVADYDRLYQLTYKDPQWMLKIAEARARQGRNDDAIAALKTALIDPAPDRAGSYFDAAGRLESWGLLEAARTFAQQGVDHTAGDLLADSTYRDGAKLYARVMTRLRQQQKALVVLLSALSSASAELSVIQEQVAKQGIAGVSNSEWRQSTQQARKDNAQTGMRAAVSEMGSTVAKYFTPEEKASFAGFVHSRPSPATFAEGDVAVLPLLHSAGFADDEAHVRFDLLMHSAENESSLLAQLPALVELQRGRVRFPELGLQLEQFAPRVSAESRPSVLLSAARAYESAGDAKNELRVLGSIPETSLGDLQARYCELLLQRDRQQLVTVARPWSYFGGQAADFAVLHGDAPLAHAVVAARASDKPKVWSEAYTSLVGLYFAENTPAIHSAFLSALGDQTIGERVTHPVDRNVQLAGDIWFYYGSRYGEYLGNSKQTGAGDFLPSELEHSPATWTNYESLADYDMEIGDASSAEEDYRHALELAADQPALHDRLAVALYKLNRRPDAFAEWKLALAGLAKQVETGRVPESFWSDFGRVCDHLALRRAFPEMKPDVDHIVRAYLKRNGNFRSNAMLSAVYAAIPDPTDGTAWLVDVSSSATDPTLVLADVVETRWIPMPNRAPIYQKILAAKEAALVNLQGSEKDTAQADLRSWQVRWARYLVGVGRYADAASFIASLHREPQDTTFEQFVPLQLQSAAHLQTLDQIVAGYRDDPLGAPSAEALRTAAQSLVDAGDPKSARTILEFVFGRELDQQQLVAANFLGLAEIRIETGDLAGALDLLRRLVVVVPDPYQNMDSAAALLEKTGHYPEAISFLDPLVRATPWNASYRIRLAKAQIAAGTGRDASIKDLAVIAAGPASAYGQRVEAAELLSTQKASIANLGSVELSLLAGAAGQLTPANADQPFFYEARLKAAQSTGDRALRVKLLSNALADTPSRDEARIPLFYAAVSQHSDEFALASVERTLQRLRFEANSRANTYYDPNRSDNADEEPLEIGPPVIVEPSVPNGQRADLARTAGEALLRLNRPADAQVYFLEALKFVTAPVKRKAIAVQLAEARARVRRDQVNASRQPILHAELEQNRIVRPKLSARTVAPGKPGAGNGANR